MPNDLPEEVHFNGVVVQPLTLTIEGLRNHQKRKIGTLVMVRGPKGNKFWAYPEQLTIVKPQTPPTQRRCGASCGFDYLRRP